MVMDPAQIGQIAAEAVKGAAGDKQGQDLRFRQGQLTFSATISAVQSGCNCEACRLLRESVEILRVRPQGEGGQDGPNLPATP